MPRQWRPSDARGATETPRDVGGPGRRAGGRGDRSREPGRHRPPVIVSSVDRSLARPSRPWRFSRAWTASSTGSVDSGEARERVGVREPLVALQHLHDARRVVERARGLLDQLAHLHVERPVHEIPQRRLRLLLGRLVAVGGLAVDVVQLRALGDRLCQRHRLGRAVAGGTLGRLVVEGVDYLPTCDLAPVGRLEQEDVRPAVRPASRRGRPVRCGGRGATRAAAASGVVSSSCFTFLVSDELG